MKIGIISDIITFTTGYGQNVKNLLLALKANGHEVVNFAIQYQGSPILVDGIAVYSAASVGTMRRSFLEAKCDYIIHHRDNWVFTPYSNSGTYHLLDYAHEAGSKFIAYTPIQSLDMPRELIESFGKDADYTLVTTKWAMRHIRSLGYEADYLYHGIDPGFIPISEERPFNLPGGTMLMNSGYSLDYRKMTPLVLLTLKKYLEYDESAFVYMHTQARAFYANDVVASNLNLPPGKVIFSPMVSVQDATASLPVEKYNRLYNAATVYMNLSASEGFGMTELEAASLGIPVIVTDFPVHREVLSQFPNAYFVRSEREYPTLFGFEWFASTDHAVFLLNGLRKRGFAREKPHVPQCYTWKNIARRLEKILEGI